MIISKGQLKILTRLKDGEICRYSTTKKRFKFEGDLQPVQANTIYILTNRGLVSSYEGQVVITYMGREYLKEDLKSI